MTLNRQSAGTFTPGSHHDPGAAAQADDTAATWADFKAWERELTTSGGCTRPVQLRGKTTVIDLDTGEAAVVHDTADEPGGVLTVACGNRRENVCPTCSALYKKDASQLVRAGLTGGKGIPGSVLLHPCVFATLTAPSFGPVHTRRERNGRVLPCRPRRDAQERRCPHGRDISCPRRHHDSDPLLGRAICPDCYDYRAAVLFNQHAGRLFRRFTTYLPRHLAKAAGTTVKELRAAARIRYVKVAEYQVRGVVHYHAVIRLDAAVPDAGTYLPPPHPWHDARLLVQAVGGAAAACFLTLDNDGTGHPHTLTFGTQTDITVIRDGGVTIESNGALSAQAVANYIAKYATKTADAPGLPTSRLTRLDDIATLRCSNHHKAMMTMAWELGRKARRWAHTLGYGGHFLTKSRRYSVTFGQLRKARADFKRHQRPGADLDPWGRPLDDTIVLVIKTYTWAGTGYTRTTDGAANAARAENLARSR